MKKNLKLPTILGLIILVFGVVTGVMLINSRQVFRIGASIENTPKNIRVSNITNNSATVSWTTDKETTGFVKWGKSINATSKVSLEEGSVKSYVHSVNILGIDSNSQIYFKINSEGTDYDNDGLGWNLKTLSSNTSSTESLIASGTILNPDGSTPAKAIVYLTINGVTLSSITSSEGNYVIPLSSYFSSISNNVAIEISVQGGNQGISNAIIYPQSVKFIPAIILGRTYDFRTAVENNSNQLPESKLNVPESVEISSRFEITKSENENGSDASSVTVKSINEGEIITTVSPEFFGSGPKNTQIDIQIESELQTGSTTTKSNGDWNWSPPKDLEPGEHKLTVKWKDANGILRTLTRTFVVSAAEGPAFESTPSATPTNLASTTPTATAKSSSTPTTISSPIATNPPVPETGSLTPTIGLFMMGFGILLSSLYIYSKNNSNEY